MNPLFLVVALALPSPHFPHAPLVPYGMVETERERLEAFLRKNYPDANIFIHESPQREKLKEQGFFRVPFNYKWMEIWIQPKPKTDRKAA